MLCTAGAFELSTIKDKDSIARYQRIDQANFAPALLTSHLATQYLSPEGLLMLTGSAAAFEGPVNYAYGFSLSKMTTHALALQMATL